MKDRTLSQKPVQGDSRGASIEWDKANKIQQDKLKKALNSAVSNATKLNDVFYSLLMRSKSEKERLEGRARFDEMIKDFYDHVSLEYFTIKASDASYISKFEEIMDNATNNEKLRLRGFVGVYLSLTKIASHLSQGAEINNLKEIAINLQFSLGELERLSDFIDSCYQINLPIFGVIDNPSFSKSYIDSMKKSHDELAGIINQIKDSVLPFYESSILDLKVKAVELPLRNKNIKLPKRKKSDENILPPVEQPFLSYGIGVEIQHGETAYQMRDVQKQAYIDQQLSVLPRCMFSVAPKTVFIPEDHVKQIQVLNLRRYDEDILPSLLATNESHPLSMKVEEELPSPIILPRVRIRRSTPTPVAVEPIPSAYAGKIIATPVAALAGALFGFAAGIVLLPFTGGTSILLSVAMAVTVASICAGSAYVGGSLTDEGTVAIRKAAVQSDNKPCKSTDDIFRSLDVKIDKTVNKVSEQLKNKVGQLKLFSKPAVSKPPSVQMKEIRNKNMSRTL